MPSVQGAALPIVGIEKPKDSEIVPTKNDYEIIGYALDKAFHTDWIYIPGLLLGIAAGFVQLVRQLMRDTRDDG